MNLWWVSLVHDTLIELWDDEGVTPENIGKNSPSDDAVVKSCVCAQHQANYKLWTMEDNARRPGATDAELAATKRQIDKVNQERNDLVQQLDTLLFDIARPLSSAPLHSESPGLMIDRLSILALKISRTRVEVNRANAPEGHRERNAARLRTLTEQRADLENCLNELWRDVHQGRRRFKVYHQMKMYNDPALNPAIYGATK